MDGGVSNNDFVCQLLADVTRLNIERSTSSELTALGTCFLAGLNAGESIECNILFYVFCSIITDFLCLGVWNKREDLLAMRQVDRIFEPNPSNRDAIIERMQSWERAAKHFKNWSKSP